MLQQILVKNSLLLELIQLENCYMNSLDMSLRSHNFIVICLKEKLQQYVQYLVNYKKFFCYSLILPRFSMTCDFIAQFYNVKVRKHGSEGGRLWLSHLDCKTAHRPDKVVFTFLLHVYNLPLNFSKSMVERESVQGGPSPGGLGSVDIDLGCSTTLLGQ